MSTPFEDETAASNDPLDPDAVVGDNVEPLDSEGQTSETSATSDGFSGDSETAPAPGGPNDPGASASDENQADTPGYSGGGDGDPTQTTDSEGSLLDDPAAEDSPFGSDPQELQGEDPASGGS